MYKQKYLSFKMHSGGNNPLYNIGDSVTFNLRSPNDLPQINIQGVIRNVTKFAIVEIPNIQLSLKENHRFTYNPENFKYNYFQGTIHASIPLDKLYLDSKNKTIGDNITLSLSDPDDYFLVLTKYDNKEHSTWSNKYDYLKNNEKIVKIDAKITSIIYNYKIYGMLLKSSTPILQQIIDGSKKRELYGMIPEISISRIKNKT